MGPPGADSCHFTTSLHLFCATDDHTTMGEGHSHPRANKAVVFFGVLFTFVCSVSGETPVIFNDILQFYGENGSLTHADINNLLELLNKKPSNLGGIVSTHSQVCCI